MSFFRLFLAGSIFIGLSIYLVTAQKWHEEEVDLFQNPPAELLQTNLPGEHWSKVSWDDTLWKDNSACTTCHPDQAKEWENSIHQLSFADPLYRQQAASQGGDFDCLGCHLSENVFDFPLGTVPPHRKDKHIEGVNCITCHVQGNHVIGTQTLPNAPCKPIAHKDLSTAEMCHGCHMAYGKTNTLHEYDEWLLRSEKNKDVHCQDCHMPETTRSKALGLKSSKGRHHAFEIRKNPDLFNRFFEARIERIAENQFELVLENKGTAHAFPTGYTIKTIVILIQANLNDQENGPEVIERLELRKATPFGGTNTQLNDEEIRRIPLPNLLDHSEIELRCIYKPYLLMFDSEAMVFYQKNYTPKKIAIGNKEK